MQHVEELYKYRVDTFILQVALARSSIKNYRVKTVHIPWYNRTIEVHLAQYTNLREQNETDWARDIRERKNHEGHSH